MCSSVFVNRLSRQIPKDLGNTTTLTYMSLEANQFSGFVPSELGDLTNLQTLIGNDREDCEILVLFEKYLKCFEFLMGFEKL
nr:isoform 2 of probable lrr receptor-like serine/threonine-protein kinase rfk1 [Quercus suber]